MDLFYIFLSLNFQTHTQLKQKQGKQRFMVSAKLYSGQGMVSGVKRPGFKSHFLYLLPHILNTSYVTSVPQFTETENRDNGVYVIM